MVSSSPSSMNMIRPYDEANLLVAIEESNVAVRNGNMPFGACLADSTGRILLTAHNQSAANKVRGGSGDVTCHAEVEVIRLMADLAPDTIVDFGSWTLYASTEPCVMCAGAIYWSGVGRLVFGATSLELQDLSGPGGFDIDVHKLYKLGRPGTRDIEVVGPMLVDQAMTVHRESGIWKNCCHAPPLPKQASADIETERSLFTSGIGAAAVAATTGDYKVPIIDMSHGTDEEIAEQLWNAATTVGFFSLSGHGITQQVVDAAFDASANFFSLSQQEKESASPFARDLNAGYEYMSQVRPSTGTADQKESLQITAREGVMDNRWPSTPSNFRSAAEELSEQAYKLAQRILGLLEPKACPNLKPGTLSSAHKMWSSDCQCTLRMLHYPPMEAETARELTTPDADGRIFWRAGPHTDWTCITLLFQRVGQAGLECCSNPRDASGTIRWTPVDPVEGGIAVNIGDMLARWSSGRLYSNLHRVRMPTEQECTPPSSRYSIAFFAQADKSALIESDNDNEPLTAGDYILSRIQSNFSK